MSSKNPPLPVGYYPVSPGNIANTVICMEMTQKPVLRTPKSNHGLTLVRLENPDLDNYRTFYRQVGENWLWDKHLAMSDEELRKTLTDPQIETYILYEGTRQSGLLTLDFREPEECEIVYFGVIQDCIGKGAGRFLMDSALSIAWGHPIKRLWLHTCNFDHPDTVAIYKHFGFHPYAYMVEVVPDARLGGFISRTAAPHVPLIDP